MNRWICEKCGADRIRVGQWPQGHGVSRYRVCENGCGKLIPLPHIAHLPTAHLAVDRAGKHVKHTYLYRIDHEPSLWKYVAGAHKRALTEKPGPGEVVAAVVLKTGKIEARVFEPTKRFKDE